MPHQLRGQGGRKTGSHSFIRTAINTGVMITVSLTAHPAWANGSDNPREFAAQLTQNAVTDLKRAYSVVEKSLGLGKLRAKKRALGFAQRISGHGLTTTKFQVFQDGIEVVGATAFHHASSGSDDSRGALVRHSIQEFDVDTKPTLTEEQAISLAQSLVSDLRLITRPELQILPSEEADSARLVYLAKLAGTDDQEGSDVYIDAHSGEIIAQISHRHSAVPKMQVYEANSGCQRLNLFTGAPLSLDAGKCALKVNDARVASDASASARQAASNSRRVLDYFSRVHGRNSFDGQGATLVSVVRVGIRFANAFWDSQQNVMGYGAGDGVELGDFTRAMDVAGHEMTHGVTSKTAKLVYMGESGALNEANSDFFGKMIANESDWSIGKALYLDQSKAKGIRDLANPGSLRVKYRDANGRTIDKPYPAHIRDQFPITSRCDGSNDNCWVHVNSTIPGHATYRIVQAIGRAKAEKLLYTVLTQFLSARSTFRQARDAAVTACPRLLSSADCTKVRQAYAAVGL